MGGKVADVDTAATEKALCEVSSFAVTDALTYIYVYFCDFGGSY